MNTANWIQEHAEPMSGDWLANRQQLITGTDMSAILGYSPWSTPFDVWLSKTGQDVPKEDTSPMRFGRIMEPVILKEYEERTGISIIPNATCFKSRKHPRFGGTPDAYGVTEPVVPDAKNIRFLGSEWGDEGTEQVPMHYLVQMHCYMALTGAQRAELAVLVGGNEFRIYPIEQRTDIQGHLIDQAEKFWKDHIENPNNPPARQASDSANAWLKEQFPVQKHDIREATPAEFLMISELKEKEQEAKQLAGYIADLEFRIKDAIGDNSGLSGTFGTVTWKAGKDRKKLDTKKLEKEHPEIVAPYITRVPTSRTFRKSWK